MKRWKVEMVPSSVSEICKHKISQLWKIKQLKKRICFANINLYWWIMSTISISILLQKNTLWFYLLWTWLEQEILLILVGRWIERSSQQISSFELIRDLLFFKSLNVKAFRLKFFRTLKAWSVEIQGFGVCWSLWRLFSLIPRTSKNFFEFSSCVLEAEFL